eukprot:jgi/Orpsp1_1/1174078/evm.model.c7180000048839.1
MKFSTNILALIAISSAFAYSLPGRIMKRENTNEDDYDYSYLGINPIFPVKRECNDAMEKFNKEYEECDIQYMNVNQKANEIDDICSKFNSEKCQKYYKTKMVDLPECKDSIQEAVAGIDNIKNINYISIKTECDKDENNNYCPLSSFELKKNIKEDMTEEHQRQVLNKAKEDTCKSQKCIDSYLNLINELTKINDGYLESLSKDGKISKSELDEIKMNATIDNDKEIQEISQYLKSEKCTSQIVKTSGAEQIIKNVNLYLVLSLISIIYYLF